MTNSTRSSFGFAPRAARLVALLVLGGLAALFVANITAAADPPRKPLGKAAPAAKPGAKKPLRKKAVKPPAKIVQIPPAKLVMPKVVMSEAHAKTCLVKVGDTLPEFELADLAGGQHTLASLMGKKMTVVVFCKASDPYAVEELADLEPGISKKYGDQGVTVVAIDEEKQTKAIAELVKKHEITFPVLLDADGKTLATVATKRLPRTYLVDDAGKILWFDTEYSATTRRDLRDAIRVTLNGEG